MFIRSLRLIFVTLALICAGSVSAKDSSKAAAFDELRESDGRLRAQYESIREYIERETPNSRQRWFKFSRREFQNDNPLESIPKIFTAPEYSQLTKGLEQRRKVFQMLFEDYYSGRREFIKQGIVPEAVVRRALVRSGETGFDGMITPGWISFFLGSDYFRNLKGEFVVGEDNIGDIGGLGDLILAFELIVKKHPELLRALNLRNPRDFYQQMVNHFKFKASEKGGKAIAIFFPPYDDNEEHRLREILKSMGMEAITPHSGVKLHFESDGVYTEDREGKREKVGFVMTIEEHWLVDPTFPANRQRWYLKRARYYIKDKKGDPAIQAELKRILTAVDPVTKMYDAAMLEKTMKQKLGKEPTKKFASGLTQAILDGRVNSSYSPGIDFAGDKEFYMYMEALTRFYLRQEPLLRSIPTYTFVDPATGVLNRKFLDHVFKNKNRYVLKRVDDYGGNGISVGPKVSKVEFTSRKAEVESEPEAYVVQDFVPMSEMNGFLGDTRPINYVDRHGMIAGPAMGRNASPTGDGKANMSGHGWETAVLQMMACEQELVTPAGLTRSHP